MPTSRRIEADDLPSGGAYAVLFFHDADGSPVEEADALKVTVIEYSATDRPLAVTLMDTNGASEDDNDSGT